MQSSKNYYQPPACSQRIHTKTVMEMIDAFNISRDKEDVGVIILTGAVTKHSVLVAIKKFEVMVGTLAKTTFHV